MSKDIKLIVADIRHFFSQPSSLLIIFILLRNIVTMRFSKLSVSLVFGTQLVAAIPTVDLTIPTLPGVSAQAVGELLNTTDFAAIDATQWSAFLDQPSEVLAAWEPAAKNIMFSLLHDALVPVTGLQKRQDLTRDQARAQIIALADQYDLSINTSEATYKAEFGCLKAPSCVLCVGSAAVAAAGKIALCVNAARAEIAAANLVPPPGAQILYARIALQFIACASPPVSAALAASSACIVALKALHG